MAEPDASRAYNMNASASVKVPEVEKAQEAVNAMAASVRSLEAALKEFGNQSSIIAEKINRNLKTIGDTATKVASQLGGMTGAVAGAGGGGGGKPPGSGPNAGPAAASGNGGGPSGWVSSASSAISRVVDKELVGGLSLGTFIGNGDDLTKDLALAPLRYLRSRINTNRDTAIMASGGLNMTAMQQGTTTGPMMGQLAKFPGSIYGTPTDLLDLFGQAPAAGASFNFGGSTNGQGVRAAGYLKGIREMQIMNPMAQVGGQGGLANQLGSYAGNTQAQQRSVMLTGGAMSMIGAGGRQKSLSEWAESILRWFEGLRPGKDRGKGFDYGQLMAQYFPGSNIDAWFDVNGVPQNMRDYWWTYALAKANKTQDTSKGGAFTIGADENNVAWQRLRAGSELTRTEFSLAGKMSGQYAQRESSNRWFNEMIGQVQETIIPAISNSIFRWIQYLPDSVEDLMMTGAERGLSEIIGGGDVGDADIGDSYGAMGGTGLSGLHPDMKRKVGNMMKANPKLRMNSGLRDTGLQEKLRAGGNNNVSGKASSTHTRGLAADIGPRSQYGWLVKNAKRFGLASGVGHGEPWHVGMPGQIPGTGDVGDAFDTFIDDIKGFAGSPEGMAGFIAKILSKMTGALGKLMGGGAEDQASFAQSPDDLYRRLAGASQKVVLGIPVDSKGGGAYSGVAGGAAIGQTSKGDSVAGTGTGWAADGITWRGTAASGRGDKYNMTADPKIVMDIQSNDVLTRGSAVATVLHNAGFSGDVLRNFMRIAYRESHWTTNQWVTDSDDTGGGILGVNQMPWTGKKPKEPSPFTQADVLDPQASAFIAMDMYKNVSPVNGPGGPNTYRPWGATDPFRDMPMEAANLTQQVLTKTGLGDIEAMQAGINTMGRVGSGGNVVFHNQFTLGVPTYGGGSNGGIDIRRTVTLLADHLEDEMKRRLKRTA